MPRGNPSPKLAITVDPDVHAQVVAAARDEGVSVSAWMTSAARRTLFLQATSSPSRPLKLTPLVPSSAPLDGGRDSLGRPLAGKAEPTPEEAFKAAEGKHGLWRR